MKLKSLFGFYPVDSRERLMGSAFAGRVDKAYSRADLVRVFGEPHFVGSGDGKVTAMWGFGLDGSGSEAVITIYDYKADPVWHIGCRGIHPAVAVYFVNGFLSK